MTRTAAPSPGWSANAPHPAFWRLPLVTAFSVRFFHSWLLPCAVKDFLLRPIETQQHVERPIWGRQPVGFQRIVGRIVLEIQSERAIIVFTDKGGSVFSCRPAAGQCGPAAVSRVWLSTHTYFLAGMAIVTSVTYPVNSESSMSLKTLSATCVASSRPTSAVSSAE